MARGLRTAGIIAACLVCVLVSSPSAQGRVIRYVRHPPFDVGCISEAQCPGPASFPPAKQGRLDTATVPAIYAPPFYYPGGISLSSYAGVNFTTKKPTTLTAAIHITDTDLASNPLTYSYACMEIHQTLTEIRDIHRTFAGFFGCGRLTPGRARWLGSTQTVSIYAGTYSVVVYLYSYDSPVADVNLVGHPVSAQVDAIQYALGPYVPPR